MTEFSVTSERIEKYLGLTAKALEKVSIIGELLFEEWIAFEVLSFVELIDFL